MTLTGFDDRSKTPEEWRAYIGRVEEAQEETRAYYKAIRTERPLTTYETKKYYGKLDVLSEFRMRATWALEKAEDKQSPKST